MLTMRATAYCVTLLTLVVSLCAVSHGQALHPDDLLHRQRVSIPLRLIRVPVSVDSEQGWFVVDTGASCTIGAIQLVKDLTATSKIERVAVSGREHDCAVFDVNRFVIGRMQCPFVTKLPAMDLSSLSKQLGCRIDGILGMDVLSRFVVRIDPDASVCEFYKNGTIKYDAGQAIPIRYDAGGRPMIEASCGRSRQEFDFVVDTGCLFTGTMDTPTLQALWRSDELTSVGISLNRVGADGRGEKVDPFRCRDIRVGRYEVRGPIFIPEDTNVLGLDFIVRFSAILDFPNSVCVLMPAKAFEAPDRHDHSGLVLEARAADRMIVSAIVPQGVAAQKGISVGDQLVGIDDRPMDEVPSHEFFRRLTMCSPNGACLTILRGKECFHVELP